MQLDWPIDIPCWISTDQGSQYGQKYDAAIYLRCRGVVYSASLKYQRGGECVIVNANLQRYIIFSKFIANENLTGPYYINEVKRTFARALEIAPCFLAPAGAPCDAAAKIIALVGTLPGPIAEEIIPHLRGSIRMVSLI